MKSYILNNYRANSIEKAVSFPDLVTKDMFHKKYRNLIDETSFGATAKWVYPDLAPIVQGTWGIKTGFPASNILQDTNTKEVRFDCELASSASGRFYGLLPIVLNKSDSEGYNSLYFKINKLASNFNSLSDGLKLYPNSIVIHFHDVITGFGGDVSNYITLPSGATAHPTPLPSLSKVLTIRNYDYQTGAFFISPEEMKEIGFTDRSSVNSNGVCYHRFITISYYGANLGVKFPYLSLSNAIATNALEVEFAQNPALEKNNRTKKQENLQGVDFKDVYNTVKEVTFKIPLLTLEEYIKLDTNFFNKVKDISFAIIPLAQAGTVNIYDYENNRYSGLYTLKNIPKVERQTANVYNIDMEVKEVI